MEPPSPATSRASSSFRSQGVVSFSLPGRRGTIGRCIRCNATTFVSNAIAGICATCRNTQAAAAAPAPPPLSPSSDGGIDHDYEPASSSDDEFEAPVAQLEPPVPHLEPPVAQFEPFVLQLEPPVAQFEPPVAQIEQAEDDASDADDDGSSDSDSGSGSVVQSSPSQHSDAEAPVESVFPLVHSPPKRLIVLASPVHTVQAEQGSAPEPNEEEASTAEASDEDTAAAAAAPGLPLELYQLRVAATATKSSKGYWLLPICVALMLAFFGAGVLNGVGKAGVRQAADQVAGRVRAAMQWAPGATSSAADSLAAWADAAAASLTAKLSAASSASGIFAGKGAPLDEGVASEKLVNAEEVNAVPKTEAVPKAKAVRKAKAVPKVEAAPKAEAAPTKAAEAMPPAPPQAEPVKASFEPQSPLAAADSTSAAPKGIEVDPLALASLPVGETLRPGGKYVTAAGGKAVLFLSENGVLTLAEGATPAAAASGSGQVLWSADSRCVVLRRVGAPLQRVFRRGPVKADASACAAVTASLSRGGRVELRRGKKVVWRGQRTVKAGVAARSQATMRLVVSAEGTLALEGVAALKP